MRETRALQISLAISGLVAAAIGSALLLAPAAMHGANGVELVPDPSLFSEIRAPGGALLALGALILAGVFVSRLRFPATVVASAVYLAYGLARLLSIGLDGLPSSGLLAAAAIELVVGTICAVWVVRLWKAG